MPIPGSTNRAIAAVDLVSALCNPLPAAVIVPINGDNNFAVLDQLAIMFRQHTEAVQPLAPPPEFPPQLRVADPRPRVIDLRPRVIEPRPRVIEPRQRMVSPVSLPPPETYQRAVQHNITLPEGAIINHSNTSNPPSPQVPSPRLVVVFLPLPRTYADVVRNPGQ